MPEAIDFDQVAMVQRKTDYDRMDASGALGWIMGARRIDGRCSKS